TPEDIARVKESYTGQFLKKYLNGPNGNGKHGNRWKRA
ncbi:MAG: UvrABC system protein A, partial [Anaerolineales bacterium]|nr:UvrABC system protein A [Anaerolineales bacterium]